MVHYNEQIAELVLAGKFSEAMAELKKNAFDELRDLLLAKAYETRNLAIYGFYAALIAERQEAEYHSAAAEVLAMALNTYPGAYPLALFHAQKAAAADPADTGYQEFLLLFNQLPEKLLADKDAQRIAAAILKTEPENKAAKLVLGKL